MSLVLRVSLCRLSFIQSLFAISRGKGAHLHERDEAGAQELQLLGERAQRQLPRRRQDDVRRLRQQLRQGLSAAQRPERRPGPVRRHRSSRRRRWRRQGSVRRQCAQEARSPHIRRTLGVTLHFTCLINLLTTFGL